MLEKDSLFGVTEKDVAPPATPPNPIHIAAQNDDLLALTAAIKQTNDINAVTDDGWTALHFAAFRGYNKIVEALIEAKIDVNIQGKVYQRTALHYAADRGNLGAVRLLIAGGADVRILDKNGKTASDLAAIKGLTEIVRVLEE